MAGIALVDVQLKRTITHTVLSESLPVNEEIFYRIYDGKGKLAFSKSIIIVNADNKLSESLDVSMLPAGHYQLHIATEEKVLRSINITL